MRKEIKKAFILTLPILVGFLFLGFGFGLIMRSKGHPFYYPCLMSLIIYSGALQYAAIPLLDAPLDLFGSFVLGFMISCRHLFYGFPLLKKYQDFKGLKPFMIFGLTDETFSLLTSNEFEEGLDKKKCYFFVCLFNYLYWNFGTLLGSLSYGFINFDIEGLDFALTALFVVLFLEQIKTRAGKISGVVGLLSSLLMLVIFGKEQMVMLAMILLLVILLIFRSKIDES